MTKIAGSGSISQRHGSADPDPDPHQNIMDPEHWLVTVYKFFLEDKKKNPGIALSVNIYYFFFFFFFL
jgi:hypothetical protein